MKYFLPVVAVLNSVGFGSMTYMSTKYKHKTEQQQKIINAYSSDQKYRELEDALYEAETFCKKKK